jgi:hypothetical protein
VTALTGPGGNSTALVGTAEQVAESILRYHDLGVSPQSSSAASIRLKTLCCGAKSSSYCYVRGLQHASSPSPLAEHARH